MIVNTEHPEFESSPDAYKVKLETFEGPLDLLLYLIRKNEVNIYDIPIALITEQYLSYIELMQELNLDVAGEFLVMAATLIHMKSRTLLPRPDPTQEDLIEEDPREALVRRLLEHQKYKAAAELLHERETLRSAQYMRPDASVAEAAGDEYEPELEVDLFTLLTAFGQLFDPHFALPVLPAFVLLGCGGTQDELTAEEHRRLAEELESAAATCLQLKNIQYWYDDSPESLDSLSVRQPLTFGG